VLYLSSAAGLLVSGYITDHFNWRLIFLPDLLYAGAAHLAAGTLLSRRSRRRPPNALVEADWLGIHAARHRADRPADHPQSRRNRRLVRIAFIFVC
jgi:MFS family permease